MSDPKGFEPGGDDVASLTGLYALDALDGEQLARFEAYLADHPEAQAEVAEFRATAAVLAAATEAAPPPGLRERVLAEANATRQDAPVVDLARHRRTRSRVAWLVAAAAIVVASVLGAALVARGTSSPPDEVADLLARTDTRVVQLAGTGPTGTKVVWSPSARRAAVVANGVAAPGEDRTFELWRIDDGAPHPVGVFHPDDAGRVRQVFDVDLRDADALGVTVEPAGGSPAPTPPIVLQGEID